MQQNLYRYLSFASLTYNYRSLIFNVDKLLVGQMPKESLLIKYDLPQFVKIVEAVKEH